MGASGSTVASPFDQLAKWPRERTLDVLYEFKEKDFDFGVDAGTASRLLVVDLKTAEKIAALLSRKKEPTGIINTLSLLVGMVLLNDEISKEEAIATAFDIFDSDSSEDISMDEMTILLLSASRALRSMLSVGRDPGDDAIEQVTLAAFDDLGLTYGTSVSKVN